jgi:type I restriction enzyme M protein
MTDDGNGENPNAAALFEAANKLRGSVESAEYKHLVLGLLFLKYISDSFTQRHEQLLAELSDPDSELYTESAKEREEVLEDRDEYVAENVFWVPEGARWERLLAAAQQPNIAKRIDDALEAIEGENPPLRDVLPRVYARAPLSPELMGSLVQTIAKIGFGHGVKQARDVLGRTYEYFIKEFAHAEGHRGGEFLRLDRWRVCWWKCSSRLRAVCSTPLAVPAVCSFSRRNSSTRTAASQRRSPSMGRSATRRPGALAS